MNENRIINREVSLKEVEKNEAVSFKDVLNKLNKFAEQAVNKRERLSSDTWRLRSVVDNELTDLKLNSDNDCNEILEFIDDFVEGETEKKWSFLSDEYADGSPDSGDKFIMDRLLFVIDNHDFLKDKKNENFLKNAFPRLLDFYATRWEKVLDENRVLDEEGVDDYGLGGEYASQYADYFHHGITEAGDVWDENDSENYYDSYDDNQVIINKIIGVLGKYSDKEGIDSVLSLVERYGSMVTKNCGQMFSQIDSNYAASRMIAEIDANRNQPDKREYCRDLARVMYRLELGNVGVSQEGVKYLNKLFDLGEYNDPDYFVRRLTTTGEIGVFDENKVLKKFFMLGDLTDSQEKVKAEVLDLTLEMMFSKSGGDKKQQEEIMEQFKEHYFDFYDQEFIKDTGVYFNNLTLREQAWFMRFVLSGGDDRVKELIGEYGEAAMKTFLSLEFDANAGEKIFKIAESFSGAETEGIFNKYESIISIVNELEEYVSNFFEDPKLSQEVKNGRVMEEIMKRAGRVLSGFADKDPKTYTHKDVHEELNSIKKDVIAFAAIFKAAFKGKGAEVDFKDVKGLDFGQTFAGELSGSVEDETGEKGEMIKISKANWLPRGKAGEGVVEEFKDALENSMTTDYRVLKKDGKIVAFMRFDPVFGKDGKVIEGRKYAGSFNVDPEYRGSAIGEAMLSNALDKEAEENVLDATVSPDIVVGTDYVEKRGFNIVGALPNYDNSGETFFQIELDNNNNKNFESKGSDFSQDKFIQIYNERQEGGAKDVWKNTFEIFKLNPGSQKEELLEKSEELFNEGYVITRYFVDPENEDKNKADRYYVFEKDKRVVQEDEEDIAA